MPPRTRKKLPPAPKETPRIHHGLIDSLVPIGELREYYMNPNEGSISKIAHSLRNNGQYKRITVNRGTYTGRPNEILAGNHTWKAAKEMDWPDIAVEFIDVGEQEAARIVADDNHTAELAKRDPDKLAKLLGYIDNISDSTYTEDDLAKLLRDSSPDTDPQLGKENWAIIVECRDEDHQAELLETFDSEGLTCRPLMM